MSKKAADFGDVVRLKPFQYIHVHDNNSNVTHVITGPTTFTRQDHQQILTNPLQCITIPPRHYCIIENPVMRDHDGKLLTDKHGQVRVRLGDKEIRFESQPFPLFPQESLFQDEVLPLKVLPQNKALRLKALRDFEDRQAGEEWLFEGPSTFIPRIEVEVVEEVGSAILKPNTGLLLRARNAFSDRDGKARKAGEEWLHLGTAFLPGVDEEILSVVDAKVLTDTTALHLEAQRTFEDVFGKSRKAGEQWLVTAENTEAYIPGPNEKIKKIVNLTILTDRQFCVVQDPWRDGKQMLGQQEVRRGRISFFLFPGETLQNGIQDVFILSESEALLLTAKEAFTDDNGKHKPGDRWMIYGPREYVPSVSVTVVELRQRIALDENEGIYVRDTKTGQVRAVIGQTYMLAPEEELWAKELPPKVEQLLGNDCNQRDFKMSGGVTSRDPTRVVTYSVPHNAVLQVYDYKSKKSRILFGPDMVKLFPDEQFTVMSLSGDKPKTPGVINTLCLFLGPDFMTDVITVETSDHARLSLQLAYSWYFDVKYDDMNGAAKVFNVSDFVGDACSAIASRIRGAVASEPFDSFHKNSSKIIRAAVFGVEKVAAADSAEGVQLVVREKLHFKNNGLVVTAVDIQSVEPVDNKTRDALMKSVQLAIEITTKSQEATARHDADTREQVAKGKLERQIIDDKAKAEKERMQLLELQAASAAIESTGTSKAEAKARAAADEIDGQSQVDQAQLKSQAAKVLSDSEIESIQQKHEADLYFKEELIKLDVAKAKAMSNIEVQKFRSSVTAIGRETIASMARAGPEMQGRLLKGLGLQGYMLTDGNSPINLMNAANGLLGNSSSIV